MISKINHIAIVVPDLDQALNFWVDVLGLQLARTAHLPAQDVEAAFLPVGENEIELVSPISEESGVARYLEKKGPGIHHICFEVDDIDATLIHLKSKEVPLINEQPTVDGDGKKIAFLHPEGTGGVLIELYELSSSPKATKENGQFERSGKDVIN